MNSPVSAFAVYKASKISNKKKKNIKRNIARVNAKKTAAAEIPEEVMINIGQNLKSKKSKKAHDGKSIKKPKNRKHKKSKSSSPIKITKKKKERDLSDNEDTVPQLVQPLDNTNDFLSDLSENECGFAFTPVQTNSTEEAFKVFQWLIAPFNADEFLIRIWERKPLHIARRKSSYYKEIISTPMIDDMLRNETILYTKNIDITSYTDGKRETHNPVGRAHPHVVWDYYLNGCSIRMLNPQTYSPQLHLLNATIQEFTNSFVGANAYLTPPDSQGFAPHYDDIEAFIIQIEGKKHWRLYKPLSENETLPRFSSKNFDQSEIGEPCLEVTLESGDMLYFPRGYIHQGVTIAGEHSLHITISMYQKHSWADLFEKMIPAALQEAITENVELRRGLPFDIYENYGLVNSDVKTVRRQDTNKLVMSLFDKIKDHLNIDWAVDEMSKNYQHDALPPVLTDLEKAVTVYGDSDVMMQNGRVTRRVEIDLDTRIRLLRKNIVRMVMEDGIRLYYYTENSLEYHGNEPQFLELNEKLAPAIESLIVTYPSYVTIENLEIETDGEKLQLANDLWEKGIIMTEFPLENFEDD